MLKLVVRNARKMQIQKLKKLEKDGTSEDACKAWKMRNSKKRKLVNWFH
jgi:ribosome recycling factor